MLVLALACVVVAVQGEVLVQLGQGVISGQEATAPDGSSYYSFKAIPFAEPPVGSLRFKDPEAAGSWEGVRNGTAWPQPCPQFDPATFVNATVGAMGHEDCLYLNVHTPSLSNTSNLAVLVWLGNGGFMGGSSAVYQPTPLVPRGVVLVTVQSRVNVFGFLSTGDGEVGGNMGLKDQVWALRWVRDNIHSFGGDASRVTLAGDEAGGAAVHYHVLSPMSAGLFQQAIMHSGAAAFAPYYYREDHRSKALKLGQLVGCTEDVVTVDDLDSAALVNCLRGVDAHVLVEAQWKLGVFAAYPYPMVPCVDGSFMPAHPAQLLRDGRTNKVDLLTGVVRDQGAIMTRGIFMNSPSHASPFAVLNPEAVEWLGFFPWDEDPVYLAQRAIYQYFPEGVPANLTPSVAPNLERLTGDSLYKSSFYDAVKFHAEDSVFGRKVFAFELRHQSDHSYFDQMFGPPPEFARDWIYQDDDMQYLFDWWLTEQPLSGREDLFVRRMMLDMWLNFINTGDPTPNRSLGFKWDPATTHDTHYLAITLTPTMTPIDNEVHEFWKNLPLKKNKLLYPELF